MKSRAEVDKIAEALGGMPVWGVLAGSPAAQVGLRYGDVVLEVNGVRTAGIAEFVAARELRSDGARVTFQRDGVEHTTRPTTPERGASIAERASTALPTACSARMTSRPTGATCARREARST